MDDGSRMKDWWATDESYEQHSGLHTTGEIAWHKPIIANNIQSSE
jgi:hypothetical protein